MRQGITAGLCVGAGIFLALTLISLDAGHLAATLAYCGGMLGCALGALYGIYRLRVVP